MASSPPRSWSPVKEQALYIIVGEPAGLGHWWEGGLWLLGRQPQQCQWVSEESSGDRSRAAGFLVAVGTGARAGWRWGPGLTCITATAQEWAPSWPRLEGVWCQRRTCWLAQLAGEKVIGGCRGCAPPRAPSTTGPHGHAAGLALRGPGRIGRHGCRVLGAQPAGWFLPREEWAAQRGLGRKQEPGGPSLVLHCAGLVSGPLRDHQSRFRFPGHFLVCLGLRFPAPSSSLALSRARS